MKVNHYWQTFFKQTKPEFKKSHSKFDEQTSPILFKLTFK